MYVLVNMHTYVLFVCNLDLLHMYVAFEKKACENAFTSHENGRKMSMAKLKKEYVKLKKEYEDLLGRCQLIRNLHHVLKFHTVLFYSHLHTYVHVCMHT